MTSLNSGGIDLLPGPWATCTKFMRRIHQPYREKDGPKPERAAQRPIGDALDGPVEERGQSHGDDQDDQQRDDDRPDTNPRSENEECDEGDKRRYHEHVAMGEVHHADDAEHHGVADGDEPIDRAERDAIDKLLDEDFHGTGSP